MVRKLLVVAALGGLAMSCHTVHEDLPRQSQGPNAPAPIPVVVIPVPVVTPTPPPAPAPNPGNPTPNPAPAPTPAAQGCGLPPGRFNENCPYRSPSFLADVERAIDTVIRTQPSLFNLNDNRCPQGCPFVRNPDAYWDAVTNEMRRMGYCAIHDGEELAVKNTNSWNDQYDILTGEGYPRRGAGAYRSTCFPAWF